MQQNVAPSKIMPKADSPPENYTRSDVRLGVSGICSPQTRPPPLIVATGAALEGKPLCRGDAGVAQGWGPGGTRAGPPRQSIIRGKMNILLTSANLHCRFSSLGVLAPAGMSNWYEMRSAIPGRPTGLVMPAKAGIERGRGWGRACGLQTPTELRRTP